MGEQCEAMRGNESNAEWGRDEGCKIRSVKWTPHIPFPSPLEGEG
ncbi:MAG: hypothetical protein AAB110_09835 [Candidatus Desantisbacteria bacterium]